MNRLRSNNSSPVGSLFVNFGGPGAINTQALPKAAPGFSEDILNAFDIIALDPRGMGSSTPIQCDVDLWNERLSLYPQTEDEFDELVRHNMKVRQSCIGLSGDLMLHMDTISVARDLEAVRLALGGEPLNWLGLSYGSYVGAQYAELFPNNIRTLVGDAITDHEQREISALITETLAYEDEFNRFAAWCNTTSDCALQSQDVGAIFDRLVQQADATPIVAPGASPTARPTVTGEDIRFNLQDALISVEAGIGPEWAAVSQGLAQAIAGDATALASPLVVANETEANSAAFASYAVGCSDWAHTNKNVESLLYRQELTATQAPHTQGATQSFTYQVRCLGWPAPDANPPRPLSVETKTPVLLVSALHDPETSYTWAVGMEGQIESAVLLTRNGDGHTSYFLGGEAAHAINAYLVNGTMPAPNTVVNTGDNISVFDLTDVESKLLRQSQV